MQINVCVDVGDPKKLILTFREAFFRAVDRLLFEKEIKRMEFSSLEDAQEWFSLLEEKIAKKVALQWLSRRNYPKALLAQKLKAKGLSDAVVFPLLDRLQKEGFIEENYSIEKEVKKWARKGFGPLLIQYKLQNKGFEKGLLLQTIQKIVSESVQREAVRALLAKKKHVEKKKIIAFLARRGYAFSFIQQMVF